MMRFLKKYWTKDNARILFLVHPFIFALSPLIYSYTVNFYYFYPSDFLFSAALFEAATLVVFSITFLIVKSVKKHDTRITLELTGLITTVFLLLFYVLFAPAKEFMEKAMGGGMHLNFIGFQGVIIGYNKILFPLCIILFAVLLPGITRLKKKRMRILNRFLFIAVTILVSLSIGQRVVAENQKSISLPARTLEKPKGALPNIYYIVLDTYAGFDVLKNAFNFDNTEFADYLEHKGFFVARKSRCNYPITVLSLGSTLNMRYHSFDKKPYSDKKTFKSYRQAVQLNKFAATLLNWGYSYIPIGHWFFVSPFCKNDKVIMSKGYHQPNYLWVNQLMLTPFERFADFLQSPYYKSKYFNNVLEFNLLENSVAYSGPKFVFAHILCPHEPFVFLADGSLGEDIGLQRNKISRQEYYELKKKRFIEQLQFTTARTRVVLDHILKVDSTAVIILQSDHGVWLNNDTLATSKVLAANKDFLAQRMPILNAYHVPAATQAMLYDSISPVNSFRVLMNGLFNANDSLLPDNHFVIWYENKPRSEMPVD